MPNETQQSRNINMTIYRKDGVSWFDFEIDPALEEIFKNRSKGEVRTSGSWDGLQFYYIPELTGARAYAHLLEQYDLYDDFGSGITRQGKFNMAFIRTVGGKGRIRVSDSIPFSQVTQSMRSIAAFLKMFYADHLSDYKVKGVVSVEIEK